MTIELINQFSISIFVMAFFFILEYFLSIFLKKKIHEFSDTITNTACGIIERSIFILFAFVYYGSFVYVYNNFRLFTFPNNWLTTVVLFLAVDLLWYFYHRMGHVVNFFWAAHITHHQSEQYNLTLSFRVSSLQLFIRMGFWMLLPIIGFDPWETTFIIGINAAYQFFIHTKLINKMGFLEKIFITPSHHRVHHGKNTQYIDKNYGGIFVIWDKMFGTFAEEKEEVQYGITKPLNSNNPMKAWFHYYIDLYQASKQIKGIKNKIKLWFKGPESLTFYYDSLEKENYKLRVLSNNTKWYVGIQFSLLMISLPTMYYFYGHLISSAEVAVLIVYASYSAMSFSSVLEYSPKSFYFEIIRILFTVFIFASFTFIFQNDIFYYLSFIYFLVFMFWLLMYKKNSFSASSKLTDQSNN